MFQKPCRRFKKFVKNSSCYNQQWKRDTFHVSQYRVFFTTALIFSEWKCFQPSIRFSSFHSRIGCIISVSAFSNEITQRRAAGNSGTKFFIIDDDDVIGWLCAYALMRLTERIIIIIQAWLIVSADAFIFHKYYVTHTEQVI